MKLALCLFKWLVTSTYTHPFDLFNKTEKFTTHQGYISLRLQWRLNVSSSIQRFLNCCVKLFNFPHFFSRFQLSLTPNKIPRLFLDLEEFFPPDHFLTCGNPDFCDFLEKRKISSLHQHRQQEHFVTTLFVPNYSKWKPQNIFPRWSKLSESSFSLEIKN